MRSLVLTVSLLCAGGAGTAWYTHQDDRDWQAACSAFQRESERGRQLEARIERRRACAAYCNRQMLRVFLGARHLGEACRRIESYAAVMYPPFLEQIQTLGRGRTLREKLAHNLVAACLATRGQDPASFNPAIALRLAVELAHVTHGNEKDTSSHSSRLTRGRSSRQ
jgi:hypothetical protein